MSAQLGRPAVEYVPIGPHTIEIEHDCTLVRLHGPFLLAHNQQWCQIADRLIAEHGHLFTISDLSSGGSLPAETRQHISQWPNVVHVRGAAVFGAGLVVSVVFSMIARAITLLRQHSPPTLIAKTEGEARAWVAELRRQQAASEQRVTSRG